MKSVKMNSKQPTNPARRKVLQGAACVGAASFAPAVFGNVSSTNSQSVISGKLVCDISNPMKTLVLHNHSNETVVINDLENGAFMFDGSVVHCNTACMTKPITIKANEEVQLKFDRRAMFVLRQGNHSYNRIQSQVTRLGDGTRVIPFEATLKGNVATIV